MMSRPIFVSILVMFTLLCVCYCTSVLDIDGTRVGGWKEIKRVKKNKEIQQLGKYSVEEYNRNQEGDIEIVFSRVVEARKQVVSGIKYYLKIAVEQNELANTFDAVVVVKPWARSKELITFAPSTN